MSIKLTYLQPSGNMTDIKQALFHATHKLKSSSATARLDAELLLLEVLKKPRTFLYAHGDTLLQAPQIGAFEALVEKRIAGVPIAYLRGMQEFWSLKLITTPATLIPRPETELLVEFILSKFQHQAVCNLLELGTGTGAITVALAHEKPSWMFLASDISEEALSVAEQNMKKHKLQNITLIHSDWFTAIPNTQFDIIISNPPYLEEDDPHQNEGDLRFEPKRALVSGPSGLDALSHIIKHAPTYLNPGGVLALEHGYNQARAVKHLLEDAGYTNIQCLLDYNGHDRTTIAFWSQGQP